MLLPCKKCQREIPAGDRVCPHCGQAQYTDWKQVQDEENRNRSGRVFSYMRQTTERAIRIGILAGALGGLATILYASSRGWIPQKGEGIEILFLTGWFGFLGGGISFILGFMATVAYVALKRPTLPPLPPPQQEPVEAKSPIEVDVQVLDAGRIPVPARSAQVAGEEKGGSTFTFSCQMGLVGLICWAAISGALFWRLASWLANQPATYSVPAGIAIVLVPGFCISLIYSMMAHSQGDAGTIVAGDPRLSRGDVSDDR